jgi:hypothetical protein
VGHPHGQRGAQALADVDERVREREVLQPGEPRLRPKPLSAMSPTKSSSVTKKALTLRDDAPYVPTMLASDRFNQRQMAKVEP